VNIGWALVRRIRDEDFFSPRAMFMIAIFIAAFGQKFIGHILFFS
jgi:hypothetical protein